MNRPIVYFAHPLGGDVDGNVKRAYQWLRWLMRSEPEVAFVAPWLACVAAGADDNNPDARERGLLDAGAVIKRCDGIVLCGDRISSGMHRELATAIQHGVYVTNLTGLPQPDAATEAVPEVLETFRVEIKL
ncbi:MAG: hypothetical protein AB7O24_04420 [Kofleriaceae bacterium]